jgi:glucokinase
MAGTYLGIEIGGTKLQLVLGDSSGHVQQRWRASVEPERGAEGIRQEITRRVQDLRQNGVTLSGAGVGFGGPVDWQTGLIACSHQIEGWSEFPLQSWLETLVAAPVRVENDANVAALGEAVAGAGQGYNPVFYVTLGSGVGGGLVVDGRIYHGAKPGEAEIGHLRLDRQGVILEDCCSGWAVDRKLRQAIKANPQSPLARLAAGAVRGEARFLDRACEQGDSTAIQILQDTAESLAFGLSHVMHLFHPQMIVLGGGLALVGERLRAAVAEALPRYVMKVFAPGIQVRLAKLGEDAVPGGVLILAASKS